MRIRTQTKPAKNGTGNVVARSAEGQKTVPYDRSKSSRWNQGNAAGALIAAKGITFEKVTVTLGAKPLSNGMVIHHSATFDLR